MRDPAQSAPHHASPPTPVPGPARRHWTYRDGCEAAEHLARGAALTEVLDPADPAAWIALDEGVRGLPHRDDALPALLRSRPHTALCHPEGRVREEAVRQLAQGAWRGPSLLPLVVIRCADWAGPVRTRARALLARTLADSPTETLVALTPLVLRLGARGRGEWARDLFEAALGDAPAAVLEALLGERDPAARRFAGRLLLGSGRRGARELARAAAREGDPVLRRLWTDGALAALAAGAPRSDADAVVDLLLGSRSGQVRAAGVTALRRTGRAAEAAAHLTDRTGIVRACARWSVGQDGGDPRTRYLELCAEPRTVSGGAVLGLAECGRRADAPLLRALLTHPRPAVRAGAVAGLRLLDATDTALLFPLLTDPAGAVVREAALALLPSVDRLPEATLVELLAPAQPFAQRRAAHRLLHARGGVAGLRADVLLLDDLDPSLRRRAEQHVRAMWSPYAPPVLPAGDPEVGALLERCSGLFGDHVINLMRSRLGLPRAIVDGTGY
ncbi:HEAT repeat domain-containing protein [Streptomyces sp. NPDC051555]|uniref:HEAT repeat domain-containing protein n=1 Tax=Streptomyces sp. NPDC051555 TaxID=3365657 RepID=UPI00379BAB09